MTTAVLPFLRARYPHAGIDFVTQPPYHELFADDSRIEDVYLYNRSTHALDKPAPSGRWSVVIDLQNTPRSRALVRRVAPGVIPQRFNKLHGRRLLLMALRINTYVPRENVIMRYLRAAGYTGTADISYTPRIIVSAATVQKVRDEICEILNNGAPTVALVPFAAWRNKSWPLERYAMVARHFTDSGWNVAVFGGPSDRAAADSFCASISPRVYNLAGRLSLNQCAAALSLCRVVLGGDTGLSHLARAVGVPTAIIYGATTWHFGFFPSGPPPYRVLESRLICRPCHAHGGNFCWRGSRPCLGRVSVEKAIQALMELVNETASKEESCLQHG